MSEKNDIRRARCAEIRAGGELPRRVGYVAPRKYTLDETFFDSIDSEGKAWLLGWMATDGNVDLTMPGIAFGVARRDRGVLETIRGLLGSNAPIRDKDHYTSGTLCHSSHLRVYSRRLADSLIALGITPRKTFTVKPWGVPHADPLARHYWRAVLEGDGCISGNKKYDSIWFVRLAANEHMAEGFARYGEYVTGARPGVRKAHNIYELTYSRLSHNQALLSTLYNGATVLLPRKFELVRRVLAAVRTWPDYSHLTPADVLAMFAKHGSWKRVVKAEGMSTEWLRRFRRRHGITVTAEQH